MKLTTLCYIIRENKQVLLGMKKRGFGIGKWNGPGGKVQNGESINSAVFRETLEETGLGPTNLKFRGIVDFVFENKSEWSNKCHVFIAESSQGSLIESDELKSEWFDFDKMPLEAMWEDDQIWLPNVLRGGQVWMRFVFTNEGKVVRYENIDPNDYSNIDLDAPQQI
eukprot:TRINITY_DN3564_c1_g2_i1.p1 TRINITY_DN3564_c1_g2~~TRINITY_DN3564_c1_g2_i1.p1  ORF type:complete len:167 (-),score=63.31 TRINITY_DN3564_c1_g2_i1:127-627(-)